MARSSVASMVPQSEAAFHVAADLADRMWLQLLPVHVSNGRTRGVRRRRRQHAD